MKTNYQSYMKSLQNHFTEEAWRQFQAYLRNLVDTLEEANISQEQADHTLEGIKEYILGYATELPNQQQISFHQALTLIEEIGSPQEIIRELNPTITTDNEQTKFCPECGAKMPLNDIYCKSCGKNTTIPSRTFSPVKQWIIDRPNTAGMILSFGLAMVATIIVGILILIGISRGAEISIQMDFGFVLLACLFLAAVGMAIGWIINSLYGDYISFRKRYEQVAEFFEERYLSGQILFVIGLWIYGIYGIMYRNNITNSYDGNPAAAFIFLLAPLYLILILGLNPSPSSDEFTYYQLLKLRGKSSQQVSTRLLDFNKIAVAVIIILAFSWHLFLFPKAEQTAWFAVPGYVIGILALAMVNGLYYSYQYSWRHLRKVNINL